MSGIAKSAELSEPCVTDLVKMMEEEIASCDYSLLTHIPKPQVEEPQKPAVEATLNPELDAKPKTNARKLYSISKEDMKILQEIYTKRLNSSHKTSTSQIMSEAIQLLYIQENTKYHLKKS